MLFRELFSVLCGDETRIYRQSPAIQGVIVVALTIGCGSYLYDLKMAARYSIRSLYPGQTNNAMHHAQDLLVLTSIRGMVVKQQHGCIAAHKELLQGQELSPVPEGVLCQQPELGK